MKSNINLCIMPECYVDTNLIETIVPPERIGSTCGYNHKRSCNKVIDEMLGKLKDDFAVGIVDIDKRLLARTANFKPFVLLNPTIFTMKPYVSNLCNQENL